MEHPATAPIQGTAPISTTLDPTPTTGPAGQGTPDLTPDKPEKAESVGDTLRGELAKAREAEAKAEAKEAEKDDKGEKAEAEKPEDVKAKKAEPEKDAKPEKARAEDGKFAKKEPADDAERGAAEKPAAERSAPDDRQSEGRKHSEPPARFLPEARAKWANVPNEVKAEFHRVSQEHETELAEYKAFREELKEYEDLAKQHNVTLKGTLDRYVAADRLMNQDFGRGVAQLMQMYGKNPAQALSSVMQAIGVTPQQFAEYVTKNPQPAQQPAPQQQQPHTSPEIVQLRQEIEALRSERQVERITPVIQNFAASHPDYHALEPQIVEILQSGVVDRIYGAGLSPEQKLAEAYRMAGGSSPSRSEPPVEPAHSAPAPDRPVDPAGQKSVRGAPNGGQEPDDDMPETDIRALLRREMRKAS